MRTTKSWNFFNFVNAHTLRQSTENYCVNVSKILLLANKNVSDRRCVEEMLNSTALDTKEIGVPSCVLFQNMYLSRTEYC